MSTETLLHDWHMTQGKSIALMSRDLPSVRGAPVTENLKLSWMPKEKRTVLHMRQTIQRSFRDPEKANAIWTELARKANTKPENMWNGQTLLLPEINGMRCRSTLTLHKAMIRTKEFADRATITTYCEPPSAKFSTMPEVLLSSDESGALKTTIQSKSDQLSVMIKHF